MFTFASFLLGNVIFSTPFSLISILLDWRKRGHPLLALTLIHEHESANGRQSTKINWRRFRKWVSQICPPPWYCQSSTRIGNSRNFPTGDWFASGALSYISRFSAIVSHLAETLRRLSRFTPRIAIQGQQCPFVTYPSVYRVGPAVPSSCSSGLVRSSCNVCVTTSRATVVVNRIASVREYYIRRRRVMSVTFGASNSFARSRNSLSVECRR